MSSKSAKAEEKNKAGDGESSGFKEKVSNQMPGFSGNIYQSKWIMWYLLKGLSLTSFELGTEIEEASKYDDLVLKYKKVVDGNERDHFIIMKSKHRTNINKKITYQDILTDANGDFGLVKYFNSFVESKNEKMFKDGVIEHAIIYTNACFDMDEKIPHKDENWKKLENIKNITEEMKLKQSDTLSMFEIKKGKFYQFKSDLVFPVLKSMILDYKYYEIAQKLINTRNTKQSLSYKDKIWKNYNHLLLTEVIDKESKMFRADFLSVSCDDIENATGRQKLRRALDKVFKEQKISNDCIDKKVFSWEESFETLEQTTQIWPDIDDDLKEFLKKSVFATEQPDEMKLGKIILDKLRKLYPICDEELIHGYLTTEIQDWMKGGNFFIDKPKNIFKSRFISSEDANHFFQNTIQKFTKVALKGPTIDYDCHIRKYKINFVDSEFDSTIKAFLNSNQRILSIISEHLIISSIKLKKKIESEEFIYIKQSSPNKVLLNIAIETFESESTDRLLVIEWDCDETKLDEWSDKISDIIDVIRSHNQKKLIIISNRDDILEKYFLDNFFAEMECLEIRDTENTLANLEKDSQDRFLNTTVKFQGTDAKLRDFIVNDDLKKAINGDILLKILKKEDVNIGKQIEGLKGDTQNCYIDRTFMQIVENDENVYLINGMNELDLCSENQDFDIIKKYEISIQNENESFKGVVDKNKSKNVYLLKKESNGLILLNKSKDAFEESDFRNFMKCEHNKCVINLVSAVAGTGKSTLFVKLSQIIKDQNPKLWVVKINLNAVSSKLNEIQNISRDIQFATIIDFLHYGASHQNELERMNFEHQLQSKKVVLLLDGIDEICSSYKSIVLTMIQILEKEAAIKTIWISTRPYDTILDNMKETFANFYIKHYNFEPLSEDTQTKYLKNFWRQSIEVDEEFFKLFVKELFKLLNDSITGNFLRLPLHTMLIGIAFKDTFVEFQNNSKSEISTEQRQTLLGMVNLSSLYDKFVKFKCEIYLKNKIDLNLDTWTGKVILSEYFKNNKILALDYLLDENELKTLLTETELEELKKYKDETEERGDAFGITNQIVDGKPQFIHRTFAEYFAAMFFIDNMKLKGKESRKIAEYFLENMINDENSVVYDFIDSKLNDEPSLTEYSGKYFNVVKEMDGGKLYFVLDRKWQNIGEILIKNGIDTSFEYLGKTVLHLASELERLKGKKPILSLIFEQKNYKKNELKNKLLLKTDEVLGYTPLLVAARYGVIDNVKIIFEISKKMKILDDNLSKQNLQGQNIIHVAVNCNDVFFLNLLNYLKSELNGYLKTLLTKKDNRGNTPLHTAVYFGQQNKFEAMWKLCGDFPLNTEVNISTDGVLFDETKNGENIIHLAMNQNCNDDCFTYLLKLLESKSGGLMNLLLKKDNNGFIPFDIAVINGQWKKFKAMFNLCTQLGILNDSVIFDNKEHGENIIHLAVKRDCNEFFLINLLNFLKNKPDKLKTLLSEKNKYDHTPFHIAVNCNQRNKFQIMWNLCSELNIPTNSIFFDKINVNRNIIELAACSDCDNDFLIYLINLLISEPDKLKNIFNKKRH